MRVIKSIKICVSKDSQLNEINNFVKHITGNEFLNKADVAPINLPITKAYNEPNSQDELINDTSMGWMRQ